MKKILLSVMLVMSAMTIIAQKSVRYSYDYDAGNRKTMQ